MVYVFIALSILSLSATIVVVSACRLSAQCTAPEKPLSEAVYLEQRPNLIRRPV